MRGTIIGSDYLFSGSDAKILEINTNTGIYNKGVQHLDIEPFFDFLESSSIDTLEFIYNETIAPANGVAERRFNDLLQSASEARDITYVEHEVVANSITVPSVTDASNKFILRHAYDTSAIVDSTYCADKFEFITLMSGSSSIPKTYISSSDFYYNSLDEVDTTHEGPNVIEKVRYPNYDNNLYPRLSKITSGSQLTDIKDNLDSSTTFAQEFIFHDDNYVHDKYSIVRSFDIIYGGDLDIINVGSYKMSTALPKSHDQSMFRLQDDNITLDSYTRFKFLTKYIGKQTIKYHTDLESNLVTPNFETTNVASLQISSSIISPMFELISGSEHLGEPSDDYQHHFGSVALTSQSLVYHTSSVVSITSQSVDDLFVKATFTDGTAYIDSPSSEIYTVISGSTTTTRFEFVNKLIEGDKIVFLNTGSDAITQKEIASLEIVYQDNLHIYNVDTEPYEYFMVDSLQGDGNFAIAHNVCTYCYAYQYWAPCGNYYCDYSCYECNSGNIKMP